ncbi:MAG: PKD repeat protein [Rhodothermales bacterium]|jgi:PKD repeat protein
MRLGTIATPTRRFILFLTVFTVTTAAPLVGLAQSPAATVDRVILISVDGLSSELIQSADSDDLPGFYRLMSEGAFTLNARVDPDISVTLPNHTSMITGRFAAGSAGHDWFQNVDPNPGETLHLQSGTYVASVFDGVHDRGGRTGLFTTKTKFSLFDESYGPQHGAPDATGPDNGRDKIDTFVFERSSSRLVDAFRSFGGGQGFDFSMIHFSEPDLAGHALGWSTDSVSGYAYAVRLADHLISDVLDFVNSDPAYAGKTAIIVTADHGGLGFEHSTPTDPSVYTIPLFVWGPGVTVSADLYQLSPDRTNPGSGHITRGQAETTLPIFNADAGNLALSLLGYPAIAGSTVNAIQDLNAGSNGGGGNDGGDDGGDSGPQAVTLELQDGVSPSAAYSGTVDTKLRSDAPQVAFGGAPILEADGLPSYRVLMGWDLADVPPAAVIQSATLNLTVMDVSSDTYGLFAMKRSWSESEATWLRADGTSNWNQAGAPGSDQAYNVLASFNPGGLGQISVPLNAAGIAAVQAWTRYPSTNFGFALGNISGGADGVDLASRESSPASSRPRLTVVYTLDSDQSTNLPPLALFSLTPDTPALGETVSFDAGGSSDPDGTVVSYNWDFGDGSQSSGLLTTHAYSNVGQYSVSLTVADDKGSQATFQRSVVVLGETTVRIGFQDGVSPSPTYLGTADTKMSADDPSADFGAVDNMEIDGSPELGVLLRWDTSEVPTGVTVLSASISLSVFDSSPDTYEMYGLLRSWSETEANWLNATATTPWAKTGADGLADHDNPVVGLIHSQYTGRRTFQLNENGIALVQDWIGNPDGNYGLVIQDYDHSTDGVDFLSRETADSAQRPRLEIEYTSQPSAGRISIVSDSGNPVLQQEASAVGFSSDPDAPVLAPIADSYLTSPTQIDASATSSDREYRVLTGSNTQALLVMEATDSLRVDRSVGSFALDQVLEVDGRSWGVFRRTIGRGATALDIPKGGRLYLPGDSGSASSTGTVPTDRGVGLGSGLRAFPNPFTSALQVEFPGGGSAQVDVIDVLGRRLASVQLVDGRAEVPTDQLSPGTYVLRLQREGQPDESILVTKGS